MRYLLTILLSLGLVLAACEAVEDPAVTPDVAPEATPAVTPEETPDVTPDVTPEETPEVTPEETPEVGVGVADCEAAFEDVPDLEQLETLGDLHDAIEAVDETIRACDTLDEWTAQAEDHLTALDVDEDGARDFVHQRCDSNDDLDDTPLCDEVDDLEHGQDDEEEDDDE